MGGDDALKSAQEAWLRQAEAVEGKSLHTVRAYARDTSEWVGSLASRRSRSIQLEDLDQNAVRSFLSSLTRQGRSPRTVQRKLAAVRSFCRFLAARDLIPTDPTAEIRPPKATRPLPRFVPEEEMQRLLDSPWPEHKEQIRDRAILEIFYATGSSNRSSAREGEQGARPRVWREGSRRDRTTSWEAPERRRER
jgi:site-specific recombinase XerD